MRKRPVADTIAAEFGAPSAWDIPWGALRYPHVALRARLADAGRLRL